MTPVHDQAAHTYVTVQVDRLPVAGEWTVNQTPPQQQWGTDETRPGCVFLHLPLGSHIDVVFSVEVSVQGGDRLDDLIGKLQDLQALIQGALLAPR